MIPTGTTASSGQFPVVHSADASGVSDLRREPAPELIAADALALAANVLCVPVGVALPAPLHVIRLSPSTITCVTDAAVPLALGEAIELRIVARGERLGPLHGVISRLRTLPPRGQRELELVLARPSLELGRKLLSLVWRLRPPGAPTSAPPRRTESIFRRERIFQVLRGLCDARAHGHVRALSTRHALPVRVALTELVELEHEGGLRLSLGAHGVPPAAPLEVTFGHFNSLFTFRVDRAHVHGGRLELPIPEQIVRRRNRRHRRRSALAGAYVTFRHPIWPELVVHRPLFDVSPEGLSFVMRDGDDAVFTGLELPELLVSWPGRGILAFAAEVRHLHVLPGGQETLAGVRLIPVGADDRAAWLSAITEAFHPFTQLGRHRPAELWELFAQSGSFTALERSPAEREEQKSAFTIASRRLTHASTIACQVTFPSVRGIEASISLVKPYARTWFSYQLARRHDGEPSAPAHEILREVVLHGLEYPQRDPEFEWLVSLVPASARFARTLFVELTRRLRDENDHAALLRFRLLEGDTERRAAPLAPGLSIGPPTPGELTALLGTLRLSRPWPYVAALDLLPGRLDLAGTRRVWNAARLMRERAILIVRRGTVALAAAIVELAHEGVDLLGHLDAVRLFALAEAGEAAFPQLLEAARLWYAERGKKRFVYFCEQFDRLGPAHAIATGLVDRGEVDLTILSAELVPDQLEHAWEITIADPRVPVDLTL